MNKKRKNTEWFNKDGSFVRRKFRLYCWHNCCDNYIFARFVNPYGGVVTDDGTTVDLRNHVYVCDRHKVEK